MERKQQPRTKGQHLVESKAQDDLTSHQKHCQRAIVAFLLQTQLYALSEQKVQDTFKAALEQIGLSDMDEGKFHEIKKAASTVFY
jgi:hypothetical protein